jgi:hypothetical protein
VHRGEKPTPYCIIQTDLGYRLYGTKEMKEILGMESNIADGTVLMDGSELAGLETGNNILDKAGRILGISGLSKAIQSRKESLLMAYMNKSQQSLQVRMNNADRYFSRIIPKEPFLSKPITALVGFEDRAFAEHLKLMEGIITEVTITPETMTVEAIER